MCGLEASEYTEKKLAWLRQHLMIYKGTIVFLAQKKHIKYNMAHCTEQHKTNLSLQPYDSYRDSGYN